MYKKLTIKDRVRVAPSMFEDKLEDAIVEAIKHTYIGQLSAKYGLFLGLVGIRSIGQGEIIPGDGAIFYETEFDIVSYKPELHEVVEGEVSEITEFGAFARIGPIDGLIHISQVMDDFVSYSKTGSLQGKQTKRSLKVRDRIRARIVAVSMKSLQTAKISLTMRQVGLGKIEWLEEEKRKVKTAKKKKKEGGKK
jgi:DNA-directed RNA polymerase subunit E'